MKILNTKNVSLSSVLEDIKQARSKAGDVAEKVRPILEAVRTRGDEALKEFTQKWDGWEGSFAATQKEIEEAYLEVQKQPGLIEALKQALKNIETFHQSMLEKNRVIETMPGVKVWREFRPIETVGLYVPGGLAAYPSTVLMLAVPARVAKVTNVVLCTPAKEGKCNPAVLVAADLCGVKPEQIFKVGGAQAIAAMAYGTPTIPKVSKVFGPGNAFVSTAKELRPNGIDIDMPAGPSEVAVFADESANVSWIAADLLSQLEHGEDSQALFVTLSEKLAEAVSEEMKKQMQMRSRQAIIESSFNRSFAVVVGDTKEAIGVLNEYAAEHLEIILRSEEEENDCAAQINNAGSVFLGAYSSEPAGDYATGANHTLPTSGYAKVYSPLSTDSFGKWVQFQRLSKEGLENLKETIVTVATAEQLDAHAASITIRFQ